MSHPLQAKLGRLRNRLRWMVAVYAVSGAATMILGAVILAGLVDFAVGFIRFEDRQLQVICTLPLQVMCTLLLLAAVGWACYRYLYRPLCLRLRDADLALRLQQRFPGLEDRLASAVEFLCQAEEDPLAGSAALRRAVIAQATAATERLDFAEALDPRPMWRGLIASAAVLLVAAILVVLDPVGAAVAVVRLVNPFSSAARPQQTHLVLLNQVTRVAKGQAFEVEVAAAEGTELPSEVRIHYRFEGSDGTVTEESEPMRPSGNAVVARRENIIRPFSYRAEGGDDRSMPWTAVEVVPPPAVESLAIQLIPPEYTGWPREKSEQNIRALVGTRVEMTAAVNRPLRSAVLCWGGERRVAGRVSDDGYQFTVPAPGEPPPLVEKSGSYWFELCDQEELIGGGQPRWEIRAVPDSPPTVVIEEPTGNVYVTSRATVPLRIMVKDDLLEREVALVFARSDQSQQGEIVLLLYQGPDQAPPQAAGALLAADAGQRRVIEHRWPLEGLQLPPGTQVTFYCTATDYRPQTGRSEPRRLLVITPQELQDRLASRQGTILSELDRVLKMQRGARAQVQSLELKLAGTGRLEQFDVDHLQAAELNQRQLGRVLSGRSDGIPMHVLSLLADLENNKVDTPDIRRRMEGILEGIERLERGPLALVGRELTAAIKGAQIRLEESAKPPVPDPTVAAPLTTAGTQQDEVIAALEQMLGQLAQWDSYRRFYRELGQLLRDEEELSRRTAELGRTTLTKSPKDLTPQESADLKVLAAGQLELARRLDRTQQEMEQAVAGLQQSDPLAAETVADALAEARRLGISGQMRACAAHVQENQIGQALGQQKQVVQHLQEVLDILANRRQHELARLVRKLQEAETDLAEIARGQQALQAQMQQAAKAPDAAQRQAELQRLAARQQQLQQDAERMARRLERLLAERAGRTTRQAAGQMGQAGQCAGQGNAGEATAAAQSAAKTLEEARRQLAAHRFQSQAELAMEQLARLEDAVKHLLRQQKNVLEETQRLEDLRAKQGQLTRAQAASLADLARLQRGLQADATRLGDDLSGAGAFQLALAGAARDMGRAAALLERRQTGPPTQQAEKDALARLELLLEAVKPEEPPEKPSDNSAGTAPGGQGDQVPGGAQTIAELKLLKLLQEELNRRTQQLQETVAAGQPLSEDQNREYLSLAEEQGRLADLVLELLQPEPDEEPDDPAEAPPAKPQVKTPPRQPPPEEKP